MSHFAAIGIAVDSPDELQHLIGEGFERGETPPGLGGAGERHLYFRDPSGAAFAGHLNRGGTIDCITPFFDAPGGGTLWRVRTSSATRDKECLHCSGADCDVLDSYGELATQMTVQWLFFAPFERWLEEDRSYELQLVGFASSLVLCAEEDFDRAQASFFGVDALSPNQMRLAREAFLPEGMFGASDEVGERATAMLTGRVEAVIERENQLSGSRFVQVRVQTLGGSLDIVAPPEALEHAPREPKLAIARVWLVGRPANVTPPPPPSFWRKP
jgi:hypothetical protein